MSAIESMTLRIHIRRFCKWPMIICFLIGWNWLGGKFIRCEVE